MESFNALATCRVNAIWLTHTHATALLADQGAEKNVDLNHVTLPPFAVFIGTVQ
jgi:hypothetical protein